MTRNHSKFIFGTGALCFLGVTGLWLATAGDRAVAGVGDRAYRGQGATESLTRTVERAVQVRGVRDSAVVFGPTDGLVQRVGVYLRLEAGQARGVKVSLTSPAGTRVLLVDGTRGPGSGRGLEGWYGVNGHQTAESLVAFAGEPVAGTWRLTVSAPGGARLARWSLTADVGPNALMAGMETYGEYTTGPDCDCRVTGPGQLARGWLVTLLGLGLLLRRRRKQGIIRK